VQRDLIIKAKISNLYINISMKIHIHAMQPLDSIKNGRFVNLYISTASIKHHYK